MIFQKFPIFLVVLSIFLVILQKVIALPLPHFSDNTSLSTTPVTVTLNKMLENYDKRIRPNFYGPPVQIGITIYVKSINSVSEKDMEFTIDFYLRQFWTDPRLTYSLQNEDNSMPIDVIELTSEFSHQIWQPGIFIPNEKKSYRDTAMGVNEFIRVFPSGRVLLSTRLTLTASCVMNLQKFPMDTQICAVGIGSYGYSNTHILYEWAEGEEKSVRMSLNSPTPLPQFKVMGHRQKVETSETSTGLYSRLAIEFRFVRFLNYYLIQVYLPAAMIVIISWVSLWMGRNAVAERLALTITSVLTITTISMASNSNSPPINYVKAMDIFLGVCFTAVFASLLQSALVGYLSKKIKDKKGMNGKDFEKNVPRLKTVTAVEIGRDSLKKNGDNGMLRECELQPIEEEEESCVENGHTTQIVKSHSEMEWKILKNVNVACIDVACRILFPTGFALFNLVYWLHYLQTDELDLRDNEGWTYT